MIRTANPAIALHRAYNSQKNHHTKWQSLLLYNMTISTVDWRSRTGWCPGSYNAAAANDVIVDDDIFVAVKLSVQHHYSWCAYVYPLCIPSSHPTWNKTLLYLPWHCLTHSGPAEPKWDSWEGCIHDKSEVGTSLCHFLFLSRYMYVHIHTYTCTHIHSILYTSWYTKIGGGA